MIFLYDATYSPKIIVHSFQNPDEQLMERYQDLNISKAGLEMALEEMTKQKSEVMTMKNNCEEEINKLKVIYSPKSSILRSDQTIKQLKLGIFGQPRLC